MMQEWAKTDLRQSTDALPRAGDTNAIIVLYFLFSVHFQGASYVFLYQNTKDTEMSFFLSRSLIQHF